MISSVSDSTCAIIPNDQILYLEEIKRQAALKAVNGFPRSSILMAKMLKKRVCVRVRVRRVRVRALYNRAFRRHKDLVMEFLPESQRMRHYGF